ncbi:MAG: 4-hydroxy-3-methylbut-2-enyl diphosphate reductase, partial [Candidatus Acidiferrales bacterium]
NRHVVDDLAAQGAVFVNALAEVPEGARLIFSAHGIAPTVRQEAEERKLRVIDATCPLVTKVHLEAIKFARAGCSILLIGDRDHDEVEGTSGEAPGATQVVSNVAEADRVTVPDPTRVAYLTQTTLSRYDTAEIIARLQKRFPTIQGPPADDICYATQNRQEAVETVGRRADLVLVVGSKNSANSNRLVDVVQRAGGQAYLIEDEHAIEPAWLEDAQAVALSAGASAPEVLVERVAERLRALGFTNIEDVEVIPEDVRFNLPTELVSFAPASR